MMASAARKLSTAAGRLPSACSTAPILERDTERSCCRHALSDAFLARRSVMASEARKPSNAAGRLPWAWSTSPIRPITWPWKCTLARAATAAENGATTKQLMAIFGWLTLEQAETYVRAAEKEKLARDAMGLLVRRG